MGIRGIERRLAAELCYEAVADAVDDYLEESRQAGRLLWPHEHLVLPIIRAGYHPPGLLGVKDFIFRHQDVARAERKHMGEEAGELSLPDEGSLIEWIMWPYPTARLRARQRREEARLLVLRQARESRRQDATQSNTLQDNAAAPQNPLAKAESEETCKQRTSSQARQSRRSDASKCNTLQHDEAASDHATKASRARLERPVLPTAVAYHLEEMKKRLHYESLRDNRYSVTIDPPAESAPGKGRRSRADEQTYRKAGTR